MSGDSFPEGAMYTRDDAAYKIEGDSVYYFEFGDWILCDEHLDINGWLEELTPVATHKPT